MNAHFARVQLRGVTVVSRVSCLNARVARVHPLTPKNEGATSMYEGDG